VTGTLRPDRRYCGVNERPQRSDHPAKRHASLKTARRADAEERPHPEAEIESAGMNEQTFEHVLMPAHVRPPESPVS